MSIKNYSDKKNKNATGFPIVTTGNPIAACALTTVVLHAFSFSTKASKELQTLENTMTPIQSLAAAATRQHTCT